MNQGPITQGLKHLIERSSPRLQCELKRIYFARHINRGTFTSDEPEYEHLGHWIEPGDWVIDLGANIGHFSLRMAQLAGLKGRVIAVEPVPTTFSLLASNIAHAGAFNVTLLNIAASDHGFLAGMTVPLREGSVNLYRSHLDQSGSATTHALAFPLGVLPIDHSIQLIKLDVEGHEHAALKGLLPILARDFPLIIVEGCDPEVKDLLTELGYEAFYHANSPNRVFCQGDDPRAEQLRRLNYTPCDEQSSTGSAEIAGTTLPGSSRISI